MSIEIRVRPLRNACLTSNLSIVLWNLFQLQAAGGGERRSFEGGKFETPSGPCSMVIYSQLVLWPANQKVYTSKGREAGKQTGTS